MKMNTKKVSYLLVKFTLLCLIMKHCKRVKHGSNLQKGGANYEIGKTCSKRQFSNDFIKNFKRICCRGDTVQI